MAVPRVAAAAASSEDGMFVEKLEFSWDSIHRAHPDFAVVLRALSERFLHGRTEVVGVTGEAEAPEPSVAQGRARGPGAARAEGPRSGLPAKKGRPAQKRRTAEGIVLMPSSVRSLAHGRSAARVEGALSEAVMAMQEDEASSTIVRIPLVLGQVEPLPTWPHGGVVIFVQFPFLLDQSWWQPRKRTVRCRKVVVLPVGCQYEIVFLPRVATHPPSLAKRPNGSVPLLPAAMPSNAAPSPPATTSGASADAVASLEGSVYDAPDAEVSGAAVTSTPGADTAAATGSGVAAAPPPASSGGVSAAAAAAATVSGVAAAPQPASSGEVSAAEPAAAAAAAVPAARGLLASSGSTALIGRSALVVPESFTNFGPMLEPLQHHFERALRWGRGELVDSF